MSTAESTAARSWVLRTGLVRLFLPLFTVLLLKAEALYVHFELLANSRPIEEPGPENCLLFVLLAALTFLPRGLMVAASLLSTVAAASFWMLDVTYYRFFRDMPSWHLLSGWRQAGKASGSLGSLIEGRDAMLLLGPILVVAVSAVLWRFWSQRAGLGLPCLLGVAALVAIGITVRTLPEVRWIQFQRRFQNVALARIFGPLYYHAYDTYEFARVVTGLEGKRAYDPAMVKAAIGESRSLSLQKTPFQGVFKGRDLIFLQLESLEYFAVEAEVDGQPVMPFVQKMTQNGYGFRLFDQTHLGRSADGQFIYLNSLHPPGDRPLPFTYPNNIFAGLPHMFNAKGYETVYLHPSDPTFWNSELLAHQYGFQTLLSDREMPIRDPRKEVRGWGLSDQALFGRVLERAQRDEPRPFFYYVVTLMCHHPYPEVPDSDTDFPPPQALSMVRRYLRCANTRDKAIEGLVRELGKSQRGRSTVICLLGDHDSNVTDSEKQALGLPAYPESEAVPFVLCTVESVLDGKTMLDGLKPPVNFGAQMDVAPTLGHVFSLAMEQSVFLGWNLFAKQKGGPRISRLGNWMDRRGMIKLPEDTSEALDTTEFAVSEMLLQGDRIPEIQHSF